MGVAGYRTEDASSIVDMWAVEVISSHLAQIEYFTCMSFHFLHHFHWSSSSDTAKY